MTNVTDESLAELKGIAGWLIFPTLGAIAAPGFAAWNVIELLTFLQAHAAAPFDMRAFVLFEIVFNFCLMAAWVVALIRLSQCRRSFPLLFVTLYAATLAGMIGELISMNGLFNVRIDDYQTAPVIRGFLGFAIWGTYMMNSRRVKNTFVN
jgi:Protein of unknown function (DUF2569)